MIHGKGTSKEILLLNNASKQKNHIEIDDLAERIDKLHKAFSETEPAAVKEEKILDSAGKLDQSVGGEVMRRLKAL